MHAFRHLPPTQHADQCVYTDTCSSTQVQCTHTHSHTVYKYVYTNITSQSRHRQKRYYRFLFLSTHLHDTHTPDSLINKATSKAVKLIIINRQTGSKIPSYKLLSHLRKHPYPPPPPPHTHTHYPTYIHPPLLSSGTLTLLDPYMPLQPDQTVKPEPGLCQHEKNIVWNDTGVVAAVDIATTVQP